MLVVQCRRGSCWYCKPTTRVNDRKLVHVHTGNSRLFYHGDGSLLHPWVGVAIVARKLLYELLCCLSAPDQACSDNGQQFESHMIEQICNILHFRKSRTTLYHVLCDKLFEQFNQTLLDIVTRTAKAVHWAGGLYKKGIPGLLKSVQFLIGYIVYPPSSWHLNDKPGCLPTWA